MKTVFLVICLLLPGRLLAQKEGNNWFFSNGDGLTFNTNPASVITGRTRAGVEPTVMSDACGRLLFYTDGDNVRNQNHQIMQNGADIQLIGEGYQKAVSVPHPGRDSAYVLFTSGTDRMGVPSNPKLAYSLIDMRMDNGLGAVSVRKKFMYDLGTTQMTPVRHANGRDFWLLAVESNDMLKERDNNRFLAFLINPDGVQAEPVVSHIPGIRFARSQFRVRASPDGRKVIVAGFLSDFSGSNVGQGILLDFDNATGSITRTTLVPGGGFGLDYDFSPDSRKVYAGVDGAVYQYQIDRPDAQEIARTKTLVANSRQAWSMRLAPDGRLYVAAFQPPGHLDVITNPDAIGAAVVLQRSVYQYRFGSPLPNNLASFTIGKRKDFRAAPLCAAGPVVFSPQVNYRVVRWAWNFGDPASGAANESDGQSPSHVFSGPGTYRVRLVTLDRCQEYDTVVRPVTVYPDPVQNLPDSTEVCYGEVPVTFTARDHPLTRYLWNTGDSTLSVKATKTGWYTVTASNPCAVRTDSVWLRVLPRLRAAIPDDTVFCTGSPALIDGGAAAGPDAGLPGTTYLWSTGADTRFVSLTDTGRYWVRVRNRCSEAVDTFRLLLVPQDVAAEIPNVFTPNADGVNDTFETRVLNRNYHLRIANRWGAVVYESRHPLRAWNGTTGGIPAPAGVYYWHVSAVDCRGAPAHWRGWVQLLR